MGDSGGAGMRIAELRVLELGCVLWVRVAYFGVGGCQGARWARKARAASPSSSVYGPFVTGGSFGAVKAAPCPAIALLLGVAIPCRVGPVRSERGIDTATLGMAPPDGLGRPDECGA